MTPEQFANLERGDIIRHTASPGRSWLVSANYGTHVVLVDTRNAQNPDEWELTLKASHVEVGRCLVVTTLAGGVFVECTELAGHAGPHQWSRS